MTRFILNILGAIFSMAALGLIALALIIGAVFWMYGRDLPDHAALARYEPATISRIYSGSGAVMDEFAVERRLFTPIEDIPPLVKQAFISAEDKNFYTHAGYDPLGMMKAAFDAARGQRLRGASTITQQVMKNFLLSGDRTSERKIKELILAARIERSLSKDKILELYLNEIFLGQNSYGVTAAAQTYFAKSLDELSIEEAAYLAALPKAPSNYHPVRQYERAIERRNFVIKELAENGYVSAAEAKVALAAPLQTVQSGDFASLQEARPPRNYFTDEIRRQLSSDFGEEEFFSGGLKIRATMDARLQLAAERALREGLEKYDRAQGLYRGALMRLEEVPDAEDEAAWRAALEAVSLPRDIEGWHVALVTKLGQNSVRIGIEGVAEDADGHYLSLNDLQRWRALTADGKARSVQAPGDILELGDVVLVRNLADEGAGEAPEWSLRQIPRIQGAFMAMDTQTGRVLAMQGGFSYQHSVFNRVTQATRQPGSSFKPFVYAAALDSGYSPVSIVVDAPIVVNTPEGLWQPKNASNEFYGPAPVRVGIERSRNLMTIRLAQDVGMEVVAGYAERFGVYDEMLPYLANSLGSQETTLFRMVAAYAMFANGGERVEPTLVDRVQDRFGRSIYRHDQRICEECKLAALPEGRSPRISSVRERVMDAITAYQLTSMMRGVVERGTASSTVKLPGEIAGKTGTTNDAKDVWFIGFSPRIVAGCYMGFDQPDSLGRSASGGGMCGPVFNEFMKTALQVYGPGRFAVPEGTEFAKFDRHTGARLPDDATGDNVIAELFRVGEVPGFGIGSIIDGGFAMGQDLILVRPGEQGRDATVTTSSGNVVDIQTTTSFGSLSSGGLY